MSQDDKQIKVKRSFIPKSLRPDVPGQYYSPEQASCTQNEEDHLALLKDASIHDIKDYQKRRKIILSILTNDLHPQYEQLKGYKEILESMFPNIMEKLASKK